MEVEAMQDRTWTLTLTDGKSYPALSHEQATAVLDRVIHGLEPVAHEPQRAADHVADNHELPLAA